MEKNCTLRFMGDVMIGRLLNSSINIHGYEYPWGNVLPILQSPGLNIINLETTLTRSEHEVPKVFNFKADPDKVKTLIHGNIHIANIANNHILDFAEEGMMETIEVLDKYGILHTGAGSSINEARKPVVIEYNGLRIGLIGCTDNEPGWKANGHAGTHYVKTGNINELIKDIDGIRNQVDLLILSIHWGPNMVETPPEKEQKFAHELIDAGVDIIHGHSAHIFQGVEIYQGKIIMYDTGDFIDDYAVDPFLRNDRSFLFECSVRNGRPYSLRLVPVLIEDMQVNLAKGYDKDWTIARMQLLSEKFGTAISESGEVIIPK